MDEKIIKVTMEFENEIVEVSGEDAQRWLEWVNGALGFVQVRGQPSPEIKFTKTKKETKI